MFGNRTFSPYSTYGLGTFTKSGINWSSLLNNTQKTLGIINQAIPAFYQIKPILGNMKTMFKVVNEINKGDQINNNNSNKPIVTKNITYDKNFTNDISSKYNENKNYSKYQDDGPSFFI